MCTLAETSMVLSTSLTARRAPREDHKGPPPHRPASHIVSTARGHRRDSEGPLARDRHVPSSPCTELTALRRWRPAVAPGAGRDLGEVPSPTM